jgi:hypothetical protein
MYSAQTIRIKSHKMDVACRMCGTDKKMHVKFLSGNQKETLWKSGHRCHDNINIDLKNCTYPLEKGPVADSCDHCNECFDSIKGGE